MQLWWGWPQQSHPLRQVTADSAPLSAWVSLRTVKNFDRVISSAPSNWCNIGRDVIGRNGVQCSRDCHVHASVMSQSLLLNPWQAWDYVQWCAAYIVTQLLLKKPVIMLRWQCYHILYYLRMHVSINSMTSLITYPHAHTRKPNPY